MISVTSIQRRMERAGRGERAGRRPDADRQCAAPVFSWVRLCSGAAQTPTSRPGAAQEGAAQGIKPVSPGKGPWPSDSLPRCLDRPVMVSTLPLSLLQILHCLRNPD